MALAITHTFVSAVADDAAAQAAGEVLPSHWNAVLSTSMATGKLLGRTTAATGAIEELSVGTGLTLSAGSLTLSANLQGWSAVAPASYYTSAQVDAAFQPLSANLTSWSSVAPASYLSIAAAASAYQPLSANLTTYAGIAPSADAQTLFGHSFAQMKTDLNLAGSNTGDQTITLTGDVTGSGTGSFAATIASGAVTLAKMANMATASVIYRKTAGSGAPEVQTLATLKTDLGLTGTNSGDQTITLTGDVTGSGTGSFAATIANAAVTYAKHAAVRFAYIVGKWYQPDIIGTLASGLAVTTNTIYFIPFELRAPVTMSDLAARITTGSAGNNCKLGIYAASATTAYPTGNALAVTGNISTTSTGNVSADITGADVAFTIGRYWAAFWADNSVVGFQNVQLGMSVSSQIIGSATLANVFASGARSGFVLSSAHTFGSFPDVTSDAFTEIPEVTAAQSYVIGWKAA